MYLQTAGEHMRRPTHDADDDPHGLHILMAEAGIASKSDLARAIGVNKNRVNSLFRRTPANEKAPKGYALQRALDFLHAEIDRKNAAARGERGVPLVLPGAQARPHAAIRREVPIFPLIPDEQGGFRMVETPLRYTRAPAELENVIGVIGVVMRDPEMSPAFRPGDTLFLNPTGAPQNGTFVALLAADTLRIVVREYVDEDQDTWTVRRYGRTPDVETIDKSDLPKILTIAVVVPGR